MRVRLPAAFVSLLVLITRIATLPQTFWQGGEVRFARALLTFDPLQQQPEPPGYPLYVGVGRLFNFFIHQPFLSLLTLSVIAAAAGAYLVATAVADIFGSDWTGAAAAIVLYFSPAMLAYDALPNPEALTVAFLAAAVLALVRGHTIWFGIFAAGAVAVRPEIALAIFAMVLLRKRALPAFLIVLVIAFAPLIAAIGRADFGFYVKTNYAALRTASAAAGLHGRELLLRFVAHPWGWKWISFPVLIAAVVGFVVLAQRSRRLAVTLAALVLVHLLFCFAVADRGNGVEPVVPVLIVVAIFAVASLSAWPRIALIASVLYAIGGFAYTWPLLHERRSTPSPAARAMRHARGLVPHDAVLLYDPAMEAWAKLSRFDTAPVRDFDTYVARPDTPLFLVADGGSRTPHAARFEWPDSDAYGKITTERYRVVSLIQFPPAARYRSLGGLYSFERTPDGREWRWLENDAVLELPRLDKRIVQVKLALPDDAPVEENLITINGVAVTVHRGQEVSLSFPSAPILRIHAEHSFSSPRDQRKLAVQLVALEQR